MRRVTQPEPEALGVAVRLPGQALLHDAHDGTGARSKHRRGRTGGSLDQEADGEKKGKLLRCSDRLGARSSPGTGVWLDRTPGWSPGPIPTNPGGRSGLGSPLLPGWAEGGGAARAGARPGGAQSLALTQLNAGAAAAPPWGSCSRPHSPAEVIMAAPCPRRSASPQSWPSPGSVSSGPARSAAPPGSRVRCSVSPLHRPPARF